MARELEGNRVVECRNFLVDWLVGSLGGGGGSSNDSSTVIGSNHDDDGDDDDDDDNNNNNNNVKLFSSFPSNSKICLFPVNGSVR
jgi:hypothetical protein